MWRFLQRPILHTLVISAVGLLTYSNTFNVPFHLDDSAVIVNNPIIKDLHYFVEPSKTKALKGFFEYETFKLRYIVYLTFALNYKFDGLNVTGYHIFNLAVHIINALLVYLLILLTLKMPFFRTTYSETGNLHDAPYGLQPNVIALFSALLFISHPVQTQAVTYIWQRATSLTVTFYLLSLLMYIKARLACSKFRGKKSETDFLSGLKLAFYVLSLIFAVLAMKTKEIAFTLPIIIAVYEFMFFYGRLKRSILYLLPVFSTMLIIPLTLLDMSKPLDELIGDVSQATRHIDTDMSRSDYLFTQFRVIVTYIRLLLLPINQNLDYDYPIYHSFFDPNVILSFLFILAILSLGVYLFYRSLSDSYHLRLIAFGIFWFFITLSVESGIIPIVDVIFEHRVYLPSVGFILACVVGLAIMVEKVNGKVVRVIVTGVITAMVMLGVMTYGRNKVWQNKTTLWKDVTVKSPEKSRPYNNLGNAYSDQNRLDEAISAYKTAIMLKPNYEQAYYNLGVAYAKLNLFNEAISAFKTAIQHKPDYADAYNNLGVAYLKLNLFNEAISAYKTALQHKPDHAETYYNLGVAYAKLNLFNEAISAYKTALQYNPDNADVYNNLGVAYAKLNLFNEAISAYKTALQLNPDHAAAQRNINFLYKVIKYDEMQY